MTKAVVLDVRVKACRPRFNHGMDLDTKLDKINLTVDQTLKADDGEECLDVDLKWETEAIKAEVDPAAGL